MKKYALKLGWIVLMTVFLMLVKSAPARASEKIDFPEDELAQESVLPKFDRPDSVKARNVITEKKFELGTYYGWNILEPIQNQSKIGFNIGYHWSEGSAFVLNYSHWLSGLNQQYTESLEEAPNSLDFSRAPQLKYSLYGHYEWKVFYGKISLTKAGVVNLTTYPIFGAGVTAYEHKSYPGMDIGIGQKFYLGKSVALRADFKLQYSQSPSPFLQGKMKFSDPKPEPSEFADKWNMGTILDVGVSFLL